MLLLPGIRGIMILALMLSGDKGEVFPGGHIEHPLPALLVGDYILAHELRLRVGSVDRWRLLLLGLVTLLRYADIVCVGVNDVVVAAVVWDFGDILPLLA